MAQPAKLRKYLSCVLTGVPIYLGVSIFLNLSPELGQALGLAIPVSLMRANTLFSLGGAVGAVLSGFVSERLESRKKILYAATLAVFLICGGVGLFGGLNESVFYAGLLLLGFATSYWVVLAMTLAEQFGTEVRATATTSALCLIRGSAIPITLLFQSMHARFGFLTSCAAVSALCLLLALWGLSGLRETYGRDLNFIEKPL